MGISLHKDKQEWDAFEDKDFKNLFLTAHGTFAVLDLISNENIASGLLKCFSDGATRYLLNLNGLNEMRHDEGYLDGIAILLPDARVRALFLHQILNSNEVKAMVAWMSMNENTLLNENASTPTRDTSASSMALHLDQFDRDVSVSYDIDARKEFDCILHSYNGAFLDLIDPNNEDGCTLFTQMDIIEEVEIPPLRAADLCLVQLFSEGMFFQFSFTIIFWAKHKGYFPEFTYLNELINWDESFHILEAIALVFQVLKANGRNITESEWVTKIERLARESYELCANFIEKFMPVDFPGFTKALMLGHLKFLVNMRLHQLLQTPIFFDKSGAPITETPLHWLKKIGLENKVNFFEKKVENYAQDMGVTDKEHKGSHKYTNQDMAFLFGGCGSAILPF